MDWKEALLAQSREMGIAPDPSIPQEPEEQAQPSLQTSGKLNIVMERKGRGGKTATIIEGFTCPAEQLKQIAATLKQKLGVGGSTRGSEILIQGDRRTEVKELLLKMGYKHITGVK